MGLLDPLTEYLQDAYIQDTPLDLAAVDELLQENEGKIDWSFSEEEGMTALHYACLNEATDPKELYAVIVSILKHGGDPQAKDSDNDTALEAILSLSQEEPEEDALQAHLAAARALIQCPQQVLEKQEVSGICGWLRQSFSEDVQKQVLADLEMRLGKEKVQAAWTSEMFLKYVEQCAYDAKSALKSSIVAKFLEMGADVCCRKNGASALLLMVLNPYTALSEMAQICRMVISKDPQVVCLRDGFKMTAFNWASDYENVSIQHGVKPNPAVLLGLVPAIFEICPDLAEGSGVCCLKVKKSDASTGRERGEFGQGRAVRFLEGDRVLCRVEAPGGLTTWEEGVVIGLWYREKIWPSEFPGAPYEVKLDIGSHVYALVDHDGLIQREARSTRAAVQRPPPAVNGGVPGGRFQKRVREDGSWELLDTKSGKARACSPPESDED
eukprot:symbB.v1.2.022947.t1/scaffold2067.1/size90749/7